VTICDVGRRDGLQNEPETLAPRTRAELVERLARAGLPRIEAVSFVHPDRVPQMAGAEDVVSALSSRDGAELAGLVLNEKGYERLGETRLDRVNVTLAATDSFSERNAGMPRAEALRQARAILKAARRDRRPTTATVSIAFGCPFEGPVAPDGVVTLAEELGDADELVLADTIGVATPTQVRSLVERVAQLGRPAGAHLQTRATRATPTRTRRSREARRFSTHPWAGSEGARSRHAPLGTSPPRISSTCSRARASRPESTFLR
jgi:hydroxymethylglutaryl-CoA lyase